MFNKYFEKKGFRTRYYLHESFHDYTVSEEIQYDYNLNPVCIDFTRYEVKIYKGEKFKRKLNVDAKSEKMTGIFNFKEMHNVLHDPTIKYNITNINDKNLEYYCKDENYNVYKFLIFKDEIMKFFDKDNNVFNKCIIYHGDFEKFAQNNSASFL